MSDLNKGMRVEKPKLDDDKSSGKYGGKGKSQSATKNAAANLAQRDKYGKKTILSFVTNDVKVVHEDDVDAKEFPEHLRRFNPRSTQKHHYGQLAYRKDSVDEIIEHVRLSPIRNDLIIAVAAERNPVTGEAKVEFYLKTKAVGTTTEEIRLIIIEAIREAGYDGDIDWSSPETE